MLLLYFPDPVHPKARIVDCIWHDKERTFKSNEKWKYIFTIYSTAHKNKSAKQILTLKIDSFGDDDDKNNNHNSDNYY